MKRRIGILVDTGSWRIEFWRHQEEPILGHNNEECLQDLQPPELEIKPWYRYQDRLDSPVCLHCQKAIPRKIWLLYRLAGL